MFKSDRNDYKRTLVTSLMLLALRWMLASLNKAIQESILTKKISILVISSILTGSRYKVPGAAVPG
jgi:hypothetical protein